VVCLQPVDELDPAAVWQADVHQSHAEALALEQFHGQFAVFDPGDLRLVASEHRQDVAQTFLHRRVVLDHQRRTQRDGFRLGR
jgi:hypothetical protein